VFDNMLRYIMSDASSAAPHETILDMAQLTLSPRSRLDEHACVSECDLTLEMVDCYLTLD